MHQQHFQRGNEELCKNIRPSDKLVQISAIQFGNKNQDICNHTQALQDKCEEIQNDTVYATEKGNTGGTDTPQIQAAPRSIGHDTAKIQAQANFVNGNGGLAHKTGHQNKLRTKQELKSKENY
eukprot:11257493-Ditylum_brightwellii.AAC.1